MDPRGCSGPSCILVCSLNPSNDCLQLSRVPGPKKCHGPSIESASLLSARVQNDSSAQLRPNLDSATTWSIPNWQWRRSSVVLCLLFSLQLLVQLCFFLSTLLIGCNTLPAFSHELSRYRDRTSAITPDFLTLSSPVTGGCRVQCSAILSFATSIQDKLQRAGHLEARGPAWYREGPCRAEKIIVRLPCILRRHPIDAMT